MVESSAQKHGGASIDVGDPIPMECTDNGQLFVAPLIPVLADRADVEWKRGKVSIPDSLVHKVISDHCTSADGRQKAYINCLVPHHHNCFLWRTCALHPNRRDLCAYLLAWAVDGTPHADRLFHMDVVPSPERVANVLAAMTVADF